jgi:hypothetical protein cdivTM_30108
MIRSPYVAAIIAVGLALVFAFPTSAVELTNCSQLGLDNTSCSIASEHSLSKDTSDSTVAGVIRVALGALAAISIVVIIVAGFQFVVSRGDPAQVKKARQTILYAVVGLVLAASASVIVPYIINSL